MIMMMMIWGEEAKDYEKNNYNNGDEYIEGYDDDNKNVMWLSWW